MKNSLVIREGRHLDGSKLCYKIVYYCNVEISLDFEYYFNCYTLTTEELVAGAFLILMGSNNLPPQDGSLITDALSIELLEDCVYVQ